MRVSTWIISGVSSLALLVPCFAQLTVDATGPIRQMTRKATRGQGGSVGRSVPLSVSISVVNSAPDEHGRSIVAFVLTNAGEKAITLPISPNPEELEPLDPKATFTFLTLGLSLSLSNGPGVLPGGAVLFGRPDSKGTIVNLPPGDSIRVLAKIAIPKVGRPNSGPFIASASLGTETIKTEKGETSSDFQDVGFATSREYTLDSLLGTHY